MTFSTRIPLPEYDLAQYPLVTHQPCDECEGGGELHAWRTWSNEPTGGEWTSIRCSACNGTGEIESTPTCPYCEDEVSGDRCDGCLLVFPLDAKLTSDGFWRVEL